MAVEPDLWIDGQSALLPDIKRAALSSYGAVTSFRVEDSAVRGLDLHLKRLTQSAIELFGQAIPEQKICDDLRAALGGRGDAWVRISLFSPNLTPRDAAWTGVPTAMMSISPPPAALSDGLALQTRQLSRYLPHLKHSGMFDLVHARRMAMQDGYDDALFIDHSGALLEGSLWNIGMIRDGRVIWPEGPILSGVSKHLISAKMPTERREIRLEDIGSFDAAFVCNSATPAAIVARINDHSFTTTSNVIESVRAAWSANTPQSL